MNKGILYAGSAYFLWGFFPIYFNALHAVPALQTLNHRIAWSFLLLGAIIFLRREWNGFVQSLSFKVIGVYLAAALLLAVNWFVYVYAVGAGFVVETSLGYFINPLVSVLLGVVILREKMRTLQWIPVGMATLGVVFLGLTYGKLPWISLVLAISFGTYGLVKKIAPLNSLYGLTLETTILFPIAMIYLVGVDINGTGAFGHSSLVVNLLLFLTGLVTVIPLLLFASGARRVTLTTLGFLQYTAPTLQFLTGVFLFKEPMTSSHLAGFIIIWIALALFTLEGFITYRKQQRLKIIANPNE